MMIEIRTVAAFGEDMIMVTGQKHKRASRELIMVYFLIRAVS